MKEFIINQITPTVTTILATAITAIFVFIIKKVGEPTTQLLITKRKDAEIKLKDTGHESDLKHALEVWKIVDDKFRITENAISLFGSKEKLFEQLLLNRIPGLTQKNIDDLRDVISGEVNQGRKALMTTYDSQTKLLSLQNENNKLAAEKADLQSKLDGINNYMSLLSTQSNTEGQTVSNLNQNIKSE